MSILKLIAACAAACALACAPAAHAAADTAKPKAEARKKPAAKSASKNAESKKSKSKAKPAPVAADADPEAAEPDVLGSAVVDYHCELGNKLTIYQNTGDDGHIALRWKTRLHRLTRVATTTGAQRFENKYHGLIWIGIPAKGMLLDSKKNRQLANECRNAEQMKPAEAPVTESATTSAAATPAPASAAPAAPSGQM